MISGILGGLGLFILGMLLLTENLRAVASDSVYAILKKFTKKPLMGVTTGTVVTALLQSSSATTLITIGLVSSGLISFPRSLSLIYGANLGTTSTAWIVSLVGLKISMTALALPLLGIGSFLRIFLPGHWKPLGLILAGFAMIFLGIDFLQMSMGELSGQIDPSRFVAEGPLGILMMVGVGAVLTVVMQSSSASVAVTLTLLHTGVLDLNHAAAAVIGHNLGTTLKAAVAAMGASIHAKRTAMAHVIFNVVTALVALSILPLFLYVTDSLSDRLFGNVDAISLSFFQTSFNILGVLIFLPISTWFARKVEAILPDKKKFGIAPQADLGNPPGPEASNQAARGAIEKIDTALMNCLQNLLKGPLSRAEQNEINTLVQAIRETRKYLQMAEASPDSHLINENRLKLFHQLDHLDALFKSLDLLKNTALSQDEILPTSCYQSLNELLTGRQDSVLPVREVQSQLESLCDSTRGDTLRALAANQMSAEKAGQRLENIQRVKQVGYHLWRLRHHQNSQLDGGTDIS